MPYKKRLHESLYMLMLLLDGDAAHTSRLAQLVRSQITIGDLEALYKHYRKQALRGGYPYDGHPDGHHPR